MLTFEVTRAAGLLLIAARSGRPARSFSDCADCASTAVFASSAGAAMATPLKASVTATAARRCDFMVFLRWDAPILANPGALPHVAQAPRPAPGGRCAALAARAWRVLQKPRARRGRSPESRTFRGNVDPSNGEATKMNNDSYLRP